MNFVTTDPSGAEVYNGPDAGAAFLALLAAKGGKIVATKGTPVVENLTVVVEATGF